ncbi:MAG: rod-binding protein [Erythrobacter sp.]
MTTYPINLAGAKPLAEREAAPIRNELRDAAQQFEAILLRQMLASARSTDFGGNDLFGGQGEETFREMRDSQFADVTAKSGQLGFAEAIENQLSRFLPQGEI